MKKFIFTLIIIGSLCLAGGYFGSSLFTSTTEEVTNPVQTEQVADQSAEYMKIENLVKTYIFSSAKYDWDTVKTLSGGEYKKNLEETIIPAAEKENQEPYDFNPRSLTVSLKSLNNDLGIAEVSYIVSKDGTPYQEDLTIYVGKENGQWRIQTVERKS